MKFYISGRTKTLVIVIVILFLFGGALLSTGEGLVGGLKVFLAKLDHFLSGNIF